MHRKKNNKPDTCLLHGLFEKTNISEIMKKILYPLHLLNPSGYVTHHQFNIQQIYILLTLYLCVLYLSENKQRLLPHMT